MIETAELRRIGDIAKQNALSESGQVSAGKLLNRCADELDRLRDGLTSIEPLFTRTAYTKEELYAHIDSLEKLGFTSYVIGRDVSAATDPIVRAMGAKPKDRWIIKVYGTEEVE